MNEALSAVTGVLGCASIVGAFAVSARFMLQYDDPYPCLAAGLVAFGVYSFLLLERLPAK